MPRHSETRHVPYQPEQLFDLVADVGRYPEFLPWCVGARVRTRTEAEMVADLTIGFGPFRESFTSRVALHRPDKIGVRYENGPFRYLTNQWRFEATETGCRVDFEIEKQPTGKRVCDGYCSYTLVTLATGRSTPIPEDVRSKYSI